MKKLTLSIGLVAAMLSAKAQDTICTMVRLHEVIEFNFKTSDIINVRKVYSCELIFIEVDTNEVLCLHLYDEKLRVRKVINHYSNGESVEHVLDSKNNVYYSPDFGEKVLVEVRKSRVFLAK